MNGQIVTFSSEIKITNFLNIRKLRTLFNGSMTSKMTYLCPHESCSGAHHEGTWDRAPHTIKLGTRLRQAISLMSVGVRATDTH